MKDIRLLKADEIEVRIGQYSKKKDSVALLLYKNSRVDMALLDEVFGPTEWQRDHKELKGVMYCGVGVKVEGEWVWRWDAGTESKTEAQKGEASDSFKRACVNWGIGRELYTAPQIWVNLTEEEQSRVGYKDYFHVSEIEYDDKRNITKLVVVDCNGNVRYPKARQAVKATAKPQNKPAQAEQAQQQGSKPAVTLAAVLDGKAKKVVEYLTNAFNVQEDRFDTDAYMYAFGRYDWEQKAWDAALDLAKNHARQLQLQA